MSILLKKPRIEEAAEALGEDGKAAFLDIVNSSGSYEKCDLDMGPLPKGSAPFVKRVLLSHKGEEYPGAYAKTAQGVTFVEFMGPDRCRLWSVDEKARTMEKVAEPLDAEELRRVLGGTSGGGGGELPEDYAAQLQEHIGFSNGNVQIGKGVEIDGNVVAGAVGKATLPVVEDGQTLMTLDCWLFEGLDISSGSPKPLYFAFAYGSGIPGFYGLYVGAVYTEPEHLAENLEEAIGKGYISLSNVSQIMDEYAVKELLGDYSKARYVHCLTISGDGWEVCLTAPSSKNLVIDSYQDLEAVFGGDRIGLTGAINGITQKADSRPVYIDLHGGSVTTDFIRIYDGNEFSSLPLASIPGGVKAYTDDVYIPN